MSKQVRCISPHGGCHNGMYHDGRPVFHVWDGGDEAQGIAGSWKLPDVPEEKLRLAPNPGGYIEDSRIPGRYAAVGQVYDVPDDFVTGGFHWEDVTEAAPPQDPPAADPAEETG